MSLSTPDSPQEALDEAAVRAAPASRAEASGRLERLPRAALWVMLGRGLGIGSTLLATIIVPRLVAPREFGELTSLLSVVTFAAIMAQLGLGHTCLRFLSESLARHDHGRIGRTLRLATVVLAAASLATCGITALCLWLYGESLFQLEHIAWLNPLASVLILLMAWQQFSAESLRGLHELRWASLLSGGTFGGPLPVLLSLGLLACVALRFQPTITVTLVCQIAGSGVSLLVSVHCLRATLHSVYRNNVLASAATPCPPPLTLESMLRVSLPMAVFHFFIMLMQTADIWIAAGYVSLGYISLEEVAVYGVARRYVVLLNVPTQLAVNTVISSIPDLYTRGQLDELQTLLRRSATLTAIATIAASLLCMLAGGWLMGVLSGVFYQRAATALAILSLGQIAVSLLGSGGMTLAMTGRQTAAMWICCGSALFLCILGPLAASRWGIEGIAASAAGALALQAGAEWLVCRQMTGIWTHADFRPAALQSLGGGLVSWRRFAGNSQDAP
ncbi:MAG: lipopolysaccharide biosynthesis protein [Pirellulaceae bacterium]